MGDPVAEQIAALRDKDWAIREEAATRLGSLKDPRAVDPLVSILRDGDRSVRDAAIGALTTIGEPSVVALGTCLSDPELPVQEAASKVLASIADERVLDPLLRALRSPDWIVRMHAANAIGRIRNTRSIPPLILLLQDHVKAVREAAASALAAIGERAIPSLVDALTHRDWLVRLHAVESLGRTGSVHAVEPLIFALFNDGDSAVREDAVRALGEIGHSQAVVPLMTVVKEPHLRTLAVEALGRIGDRRAVPLLIDIVRGTHPPEATRPITGCGDQWSEEVITQAAAVQALGAIGDESALPFLVAALEPTCTRAAAAAALARLGTKAIPSLLSLLTGHRDDNVRSHVKDTLMALGWRPGRL
ncbi:MAG TPA: HEAT repeat domain-containing protein [Nitrospira sp.]|nr:HEAT repeat domain-containing protein [Nitrospira sp.]